MLPGKLPPLLAADDSSQILNRSLDRSSVRQGTYDGRSFSPSPRDSSIHSQTIPCPIGWPREFVLSGHPFQPLKIAGVHDHDRDHRL